MIISVHQPQYLPWLGYFDKIASSDLFVIADLPQYKKREFQNRNYIKGPRGKILLTVPVRTRGKYEQAIKDVEIDNSTSWQEQHWRSLTYNLARTPYWHHYRSGLEAFYLKSWHYLAELNYAMTMWFLEQLGMQCSITLESQLGTTSRATERLIELCQKTQATHYFSGIGGSDYLDEARFRAAQLGLVYQRFHHPCYPQLFGEFQSNLSIIDLLMNVGPESLTVLRSGVS